MTEEEAKALREQLEKAQDSISKLEEKNREIIVKNKKLSAQNENFDIDEYNKLVDENESLKSDYKKLEKANNVQLKDMEKLTASLAEKDGSLSKLLIDDGIAKSLNSLEKFKLNDGALELATMAIKAKGATLVDGVAMVGDKPLGEFISNDWINDSMSKNLITPNENSGGGAGGGNNSGGQQKVGKLDGSKAEQEAYIKAKFNLEK